MDMCSNNHDEIVHNERHCPLCAALDHANEMLKMIEDLKEQMDKMEIA